MQVHQPKEGGAQHNPPRPLHLMTIADVPEKRCRKCDDTWPADAEFFYRQAAKADGLSDVCKACYAELPSVIAAGRYKGRRISSAWEALFDGAQEAAHA
jgi:ribosomal protein L40E